MMSSIFESPPVILALLQSPGSQMHLHPIRSEIHTHFIIIFLRIASLPSSPALKELLQKNPSGSNECNERHDRGVSICRLAKSSIRSAAPFSDPTCIPYSPVIQ